MKKPLPTAEEVLLQYNSHQHDCGCEWRNVVAMRAFAKMHVEAAIESIVKRAKTKERKALREASHGIEFIRSIVIDKKSIKTAYPLDNIE